MNEIPITRLDFDAEAEASMAAVLRTGWIGQGKKVEEFERSFASVVGSEFAVAMNSGTMALYLALRAARLDPGKEVICPSHSFIATANSIRLAGLRPRFVDVDARTFNMVPGEVQKAISKATGAIMPVHQLGLSADMDALTALSQEAHIPLIEDAACSLGSFWRGRMTGAFGLMGCYSFHPRKVLSTGEGGMVVTSDTRLAEEMKMLRNHGAFTAGGEVIFREVGVNGRLTDLQAALGLWGLARVEGWIESRRSIAHRYDEAFFDLPGVQIPWAPPFAKHNYQSYCIVLLEDCPASRDGVAEQLGRDGIAVRTGIKPIHLEPCYAEEWGKDSLPVTERLYRRSLFLPLFPGMSDDEQSRVILSFQKAIRA